MQVSAGRDELWQVVEAVGGDRGWYGTSLAWVVRGLLDRAVGGPGLRRGRPERLQAGDAVDCWRVEQVVPGTLLRLRAEMRLPGTARLELAVEADGTRSVLVQRTSFEPRGLAGRTYWRAVAPLHGVVFARMLRGMAAAAERG